MKKDKGFALLELLVIVAILAIILTVAVPQVQNLIKSNEEEKENGVDSTKESLKSSIKMIALSAESEYTIREVLGNTKEEMICSEVANFSEENYETCTISFTDGKATVTIVGEGEFEGYTCTGTKTDVSCTISDKDK